LSLIASADSLSCSWETWSAGCSEVRHHAFGHILIFSGGFDDAGADGLLPSGVSRSRRSTKTHFSDTAAEGFRQKSSKFTAAMLNWVLDRQTSSVIALGTFVMDPSLLYVVSPKGFFPLQITASSGDIRRRSSPLLCAMAERQQQLASAILRIPDVASLSFPSSARTERHQPLTAVGF